jgi:hypothetical protein
MKVAKRDLVLVVLYLLPAIGAFPIVYYLFQYYILGFTIDPPDRFGTARVAFSGPILIVTGIVLRSLSFTNLVKDQGASYLWNNVLLRRRRLDGGTI